MNERICTNICPSVSELQLVKIHLVLEWQNSQTDGLQIRKEVKTKLSATLFERQMQLLFTKATVPRCVREIGE